MSINVKLKEKLHLQPLTHFKIEDVIVLCRAACDYLENGPASKYLLSIYKSFVDKYKMELLMKEKDIQYCVEALISLLIDTALNNTDSNCIKRMLYEYNFKTDVVEVLSDFFRSKRASIMRCIQAEDIEYHLINLDWRLEVRLASRALLKQNALSITIKLSLHTEPKKQSRYLLNALNTKTTADISEFDKGKRKDVLVQIDVSSLKYLINNLEQALLESRTRRVQNILTAL